MTVVVTKDVVASIVADLADLLWGEGNEPRNQVLKVSLREKLEGYHLEVIDTQQQDMWPSWEPVELEGCTVKVKEILPMSAGRARLNIQVSTYPTIHQAGILDGLCKETATISLRAMPEESEEQEAA
jgi:hypothetical protein